MSTDREDQFRQAEDEIYRLVKDELENRAGQFDQAGLQMELDPIFRSGTGSNYKSYVEATLRFEDGEVHDIIFFHVASEGRLRVEAETLRPWLREAVDEALAAERR